MSAADKSACACRDQRKWPELLATFHPDGEIAVSWFRGPFAAFVERCKQGGRSKHLIFPPIVRVNGERAVAETSIAILVRQDIGGVAVDMTSRARFLDRLERRQAQWKILERAAIYEQDRLDPVTPSDVFDTMMREADVAAYPEPYRYMALRLAAVGRPLAMPVHYDGLPETAALYERYEAWLAGK